MSKFPLLDQLRAECQRREDAIRQRHEDAITAPFRQELDRAASMISRLRMTVREMERMLGTQLGQQMAATIADQMSAKLHQLVMEASAKAGSDPTEPILLTLDPQTLRFMDPRSLENEILRRYSHETMPRLRLRVDDRVSPSECMTVVDIRIPELGYRHAMAQI